MVYPPAYQQVLKGMPAVNYSARDIIYRPRNVRAYKVYGYSPVQQVLKGMPAVNYSARDIIYRPRNVRAHKVYGYSPVQQVLMTVNIALRRQLWQLDYFTEGSIPDALIGVPQGWTPEQIKQFQDYWDTEFAGDLAKRRRAKFVPGDTAAKVVQTKEPQHKDDFDEWLARIICFAFSVPPQWAVKLMNRATADNQSAQSEKEGLEPTKEWVKDLVDEIISEEFTSPDLELHWLDEDADPAQHEAVLEGRVKLGAVTLNEMRDHLGLDPYTNAAADRPMVLTPNGIVPIEANAGGNGDASANTNGQAAPAVQKYSPNQPRVPAGNPYGGQWTSEGGSGSSSGSMAEDGKSNSGVRYAALNTGTRTDATVGESGVQVAAGTGRPGYPIDLQEEEALGGHTIGAHVGRSDSSLLSDIRKTALSAGDAVDFANGLREGSFPSLEAANKLVNATIAQNQDKLDLVTGGLSPREELDADFSSPTGYEAFAQTGRSTPYVRPTYGVRVVIVPDQNSPKGYRIDTAFPINF
jgi:hypothetical protein